MHDVWSSANYEAHLLSLPFALAPAALLIVIAYTAVMRGAPALRGWLLAHCLCLLPYAVVMMLSPSIVDGSVALALLQFASSFIPMAAICGTGFQLTLIRKFRPYRALVWIGVATAIVWILVSSMTDLTLRTPRRLDAGLWYATAGPGGWIAFVHTVVLSIGGFLALASVALRSAPSDDRRQLRLILLANVVTYAGLIDVGIAYGIGVFPLGWLLSGTGSLLVVRALVVEDLLRVRAIDTRAPLLVLHLAGAILLGWIVLEQLDLELPWWLLAITLCMCFGAVRASVATVSLVNRGGRGGDSPLDRLLAQLVGRARTITGAPAIAQLAIDIIDLGIGARPTILLASAEDWGWTSETGARVDDALAPDPLLMSWLAERRSAVFAEDLDAVPADLRELLALLFERHAARVIVPVGSADELIGLVVVAIEPRRLRGRTLSFLERAAERFAEALLHARMVERAATRANLAREVELAATVQGDLLPGKEPHVLGPLTVVGSWQPATRCAGDFWGLYSLGGPLADGRVLVAIGDVTGHGVASAMVTAAAVGAVDVCVRRSGHELDLRELTAALDLAVRRVGGGQLAMTCFAAILDPQAREITFVSCGHPFPYLCRASDKGVELHPLVGRGNLLGAGQPAVPKVLTRPIQPGDLLVCYTDGVIEAQDPAATPFGDRRLQQLLRRLDKQRLTPAAVHDVIQAGVAAHRAGHPLADDETVVIAQLAREAAP